MTGSFNSAAGAGGGRDHRRSGGFVGYALMLGVFLVTITWYIGTVAMLSDCKEGDGPPAPGVIAAGDHSRLMLAVVASPSPSPPAEEAPTPEEAPEEFVVEMAPELLGDPAVAEAAASLMALLDASEEGGEEEEASFGVAARFLAQAVLAAGIRGAVPPTPSPAAAKPAAAGGAGREGGRAEPSHRPTRPEYTQQTCYLNFDESEICVFDNLLCFDGKSPVIVVDDPVRDPERILDYTHSCQDFRYYEPSALGVSGCAYAYSFDRPYNHTQPVRPASDFPLPLERRRWGPQNRNGLLFFKELSPAEVWGPPVGLTSVPPTDYTASAPPLGREDKAGMGPWFEGNPGVNTPISPPFFNSPSGRFHSGLVKEGPFKHETVAGLTIAQRTRVGNRTIDWVDGSLWLAGIDGQFWQNPYHWWSKVGALYDATRANVSRGRDGRFGHPDDGFFSTVAKPGATVGGAAGVEAQLQQHAPNGNAASWRVGRQWDMPSMDYVAFAGDGAIVLKDKNTLNSWFRSTVELAMQPHTNFFFADLITALDDWHYVCTTRGAIPSAKNKMFSGRSDAWMWRQYAYDAAGLGAAGTTPHPRYPPRKVTVLARKGLNGRGIFNIDSVLAAVNASGLPYEMVPNMAALSFNKQVELMAGTGILIAPHGAHLSNAMFLPAHAVVIELFPYLMKKNTYRHLATLLDLTYMPVYSWELLPLNETYARQFYGVDLMREKYYYDKCVRINISSYEALTEHACNAMSKNYPIIVAQSQIEQIMRDAADAIGAFSLLNPAWAAVAGELGVPVPPFAAGEPGEAPHTHSAMELPPPPPPPPAAEGPGGEAELAAANAAEGDAQSGS